RTEGDARAGVALAEDAEARPVLRQALPEDDEVAGAVGRHRGTALVARGEGVDSELRTERSARPSVPLAEDALAGAVLQRALPHDDEVAGGIGGGGRTRLIVRRVRVDTELGAYGRTGACEPLTVDAVPRAVLGPAVPNDHEVAGRIHGNRRDGLMARRVGVDAEHGAERRTRVGEALTKYVAGGRIREEVFPDDDEVAGRVGGN